MSLTLQEIAGSLGGEVRGNQVLVPGPGHKPKDRSLAVMPSSTAPDGFVVHSHAGDDPIVCKDYVREKLGLAPFKPRGAERAGGRHRAHHGRNHGEIGDHGGIEVRLANRECALKLSAAAEPLTENTLGWYHLTEHRGIRMSALGDLSHALRWLGSDVNAIVGLMTDAVTGTPSGIQRIFISTNDGSNIKDATGKNLKKMLGRQGVIRLSPDEEVTLGLGLTEGIEDGLAVLLSGWAPVWCATSAGAIERFPVLPGIDALTIFHDRDNAGKRAAEVCAERWASAGREVFLA